MRDRRTFVYPPVRSIKRTALTAAYVALGIFVLPAHGADKGVRDLNVDLRVSVKELPNVAPMILPMTGEPSRDAMRVLNLQPEAKAAEAGQHLMLKVNLFDSTGKQTVPLQYRFLRFHTTSHKLHMCGDYRVCLWPKNKAPDVIVEPPSARYGIATVTVEYATPDGKLGINGIALNIQPTSAQKAAMERAAQAEVRQREAKEAAAAAAGPAPVPPIAGLAPVSAELWRQVRSLRGTPTQEGLQSVSLYVFYDPNCPFSAKLWQASVGGKPFADVPAIWVPVTYLDNTSLGKAAALLRSGSKADLARNFAAFPAGSSGATAPVTPSEAERVALSRAKTVWNQLGQGTPALVFRGTSGQAQVFLGFDLKRLEAITVQLALAGLERYPR